MAQSTQQPQHLNKPATPPQAASAVKTSSQQRMFKIGPLVLIVCLAVAILTVLSIPMIVNGTTLSASKPVSSGAASVSIVTYASPEEAAAAVNLSSALPHALPEGAGVSASRVVEGSMLELEVLYGKNTFVYRAAAGSNDLSGMDYDSLAYTATEDTDGVVIDYAGLSPKKVTSAVWLEGDYSYALVFKDGIDQDSMRDFSVVLA